MKLNDVSLVPELSRNLLYVAQLTRDNDYSIDSSLRFLRFCVKDLVARKPILKGLAEQGLYPIERQEWHCLELKHQSQFGICGLAIHPISAP